MTDTPAPLGIGIVGVGGIALSHMAALRASTDAKLIGVTDLATERAAEAARAENCIAYDDIDAMLADDAIEAVIICTPNMTHEPLGHRVLSAGKHLLVEKPMALTVEGAQSLADEAERRGLAVAVGHTHRFSDQGLEIKQAIESGVIGEPRFVRIVMNGGWIWPGWQTWTLDPALSGGHSLHNGVHLTDLASWWIGEPATSVRSAGQHATSAALQIHDYLVVELGFPSGASAICEVSRGERPRNSSFLELVVVGTEGVLSREWDAEGIMAWTDAGQVTWAPDGGGARMFSRELSAFVAAARGTAPAVPPPAAAVAAVAVGVASEKSLRDRATHTIGEVK